MVALEDDTADDRQYYENDANRDRELEEGFLDSATSSINRARIAAEGAAERRALGLQKDHGDKHKPNNDRGNVDCGFHLITTSSHQ